MALNSGATYPRGGKMIYTPQSTKTNVYIYITGHYVIPSYPYAIALTNADDSTTPTGYVLSQLWNTTIDPATPITIYLQQVNATSEYVNFLPYDDYKLNIVIDDDWANPITYNFTITEYPFSLDHNMKLTYTGDDTLDTSKTVVSLQLGQVSKVAWTCTYKEYVDPGTQTDFDYITPDALWTPPGWKPTLSTGDSVQIYFESPVAIVPTPTSSDDYELQYLPEGDYTLRITDFLQIYYETPITVVDPTISVSPPSNDTITLTVNNFPQVGYVLIYNQGETVPLDWARYGDERVFAYSFHGPTDTLVLNLTQYAADNTLMGLYPSGNYRVELTDFFSMTTAATFTISDPNTVYLLNNTSDQSRTITIDLPDGSYTIHTDQLPNFSSYISLDNKVLSLSPSEFTTLLVSGGECSGIFETFNAKPSYSLVFTGSGVSKSIPIKVSINYEQVILDAINLLKQINYGTTSVEYRSADTNIFSAPPVALNNTTPEAVYGGTHTNYLPCFFLSTHDGYSFNGTQLDSYEPKYTADNVRYLWRMSNYVRANPANDSVATMVTNVCKGLTYAFNKSNSIGQYNQNFDFNIYTLDNTNDTNQYSGDMITPLLAGIHSVMSPTMYSRMTKFMDITNFTNENPKGLVPVDFDYFTAYATGMKSNVYPFMDSAIGAGGQQFGLTMVGLSCTAEILLNSHYNTMSLYDDKTVSDYPFSNDRTAFDTPNIVKMLEFYYILGYTGHYYHNKSPSDTSIKKNAYIVNVKIDDIHTDNSPDYEMWCIPDAGWTKGFGTAEIFSYQLLVAALYKDYAKFCKFHRMYYYFLFIQNGGQMDQSQNLWEGIDSEVQVDNTSGSPAYNNEGSVIFKMEKEKTSKQVSYGNTNPNYNGNWQPSYYKNKADPSCPTFEGAYFQDTYNYYSTFNRAKLDGELIAGGWVNFTQTPVDSDINIYNGTPRNRYTCGFSRPSYLMGYAFDCTEDITNTPPLLSSGNKETILANGPYYTVKNPYYKWDGGTLRSATDADLNIFMAYYIADKLSNTADWSESDMNGVTVLSDLSLLKNKAIGKGVKWSTMKKEIARSFNENTGGASYGYYQQTSSNIIARTPPGSNGVQMTGLGHDTDSSAEGNTRLHLDYTDLRAYQLLQAEQLTSGNVDPTL